MRGRRGFLLEVQHLACARRSDSIVGTTFHHHLGAWNRLYSTIQSYKLCGHLIPFNISHSSKVLKFQCHGETFQCIKCQHTLQDNLQFAPE